MCMNVKSVCACVCVHMRACVCAWMHKDVCGRMRIVVYVRMRACACIGVLCTLRVQTRTHQHSTIIL